MDGSYSIFGGREALDFSWLLRLTEDDKVEYGMEQKYAATAFNFSPVGGTPKSTPGTFLCDTSELDISKNYNMESRNSTASQIVLEMNGDKYWGIDVDNFSDKLYVTDRLNNSVIIVDPVVGAPVSRFGQESTMPYYSNLYRPTGVVVDAANKRILTCDKDNHRIAIYSVDGKFIHAFGKKGHGPGEFNYPWDIDVSSNGENIAVSDSRNHRIQIFDRFGNYLKKFTVFESDPFEYKKYFDYPRGISFDKEGKCVYVSDFNTNNVVRLEIASWDFKMLVPHGKMNRPQGVTLDDAGNILVCDSRRHCVRVMTSNGDLVSTINGAGRNQLTVPVDVCVLRSGKVATLGLNGRINFV